MKTSPYTSRSEAVHRLANKGKIPLELIEVQTGSYLGEDDIERLEDVYKRTTTTWRATEQQRDAQDRFPGVQFAKIAIFACNFFSHRRRLYRGSGRFTLCCVARHVRSFYASVAANSTPVWCWPGRVPAAPQADQRFHCFDLEEPLKQAIKLGHELVFYFQLFVQMIEGNEVTKLEQKLVPAFSPKLGRETSGNESSGMKFGPILISMKFRWPPSLSFLIRQKTSDSRPARRNCTVFINSQPLQLPHSLAIDVIVDPQNILKHCSPQTSSFQLL